MQAPPKRIQRACRQECPSDAATRMSVIGQLPGARAETLGRQQRHGTESHATIVHMYPEVQKFRYVRECKSPDVRRIKHHKAARYPRSKYPKAGHPNLRVSMIEVYTHRYRCAVVNTLCVHDRSAGINDATHGLHADETITLDILSFDQKEHQAIVADVLTRRLCDPSTVVSYDWMCREISPSFTHNGIAQPSIGVKFAKCIRRKQGRRYIGDVLHEQTQVEYPRRLDEGIV
jgi:hypothetical protein